MKRLLTLLLVALAMPAAAFAATESGNSLRPFGTGTVTNEGGAITLTNDAGEYSGVYLPGWLRGGPALDEISSLSFEVSGQLNASSPRVSLPIDIDCDGDTEAWAYLSAFYCLRPQTYPWQPVNFLYDCQIYTSLGGPHVGIAGLAAAYPDARVATDNYVFIVLDDSPATAGIRNVSIGR